MEYAVDLGRGHSVLQDTEGYLFTQDSVVCANLMPAGSRDRLLDLGCGMGVMSVLAVLKKGVREAVGLDVDERACELARKNAERCGIADRMTVVTRDVRGAAETLGRESFDKVVCNPPYFDFDDGTDGGRLASAKREGAANLADFIATGAACLRFGGDFTEFVGEMDLVLNRPVYAFVEKGTSLFKDLRKTVYLIRNRDRKK